MSNERKIRKKRKHLQKCIQHVVCCSRHWGKKKSWMKWTIWEGTERKRDKDKRSEWEILWIKEYHSKMINKLNKREKHLWKFIGLVFRRTELNFILLFFLVYGTRTKSSKSLLHLQYFYECISNFYLSI